MNFRTLVFIEYVLEHLVYLELAVCLFIGCSKNSSHRPNQPKGIFWHHHPFKSDHLGQTGFHGPFDERSFDNRLWLYKISLRLMKPFYPQTISTNEDNLLSHSLETPSRIFREWSRDFYRSHDSAGHLFLSLPQHFPLKIDKSMFPRSN